MSFSKKPISFALLAATLAAAPALTMSTAAQAEVTGNVGVVSKYIFRGGGVVGGTTDHENDGAAVQGGLNYAHDSGFHANYWGSSLDYGNADANTGFENDVWVGYSGAAGEFNYDISLFYYHYVSVDDANTPELSATIGYGPFSAGLAYLVEDVVWGNQGDIYWNLAYTAALPSDFTLGAKLGYYTYKEDGDFITGSESSGFKHFDLTLSHPLGATGATMSLTYMKGGKDRFDADIEDAVVIGANFGF